MNFAYILWQINFSATYNIFRGLFNEGVLIINMFCSPWAKLLEKPWPGSLQVKLDFHMMYISQCLNVIKIIICLVFGRHIRRNLFHISGSTT